MDQRHFAEIARKVSAYLVRSNHAVSPFVAYERGQGALVQLAAEIGVTAEELRDYVLEADRQLPAHVG